jgi:hypothetical protein
LNQIAGASLSCPRDFFCENASIEDSIAQIGGRPFAVIGVVWGKVRQPNSSANTSSVENCSSHFQYARDNVPVGESAEVDSTGLLDRH